MYQNIQKGEHLVHVARVTQSVNKARSSNLATVHVNPLNENQKVGFIPFRPELQKST